LGLCKGLYHCWFQISPIELLETVDGIMPRVESFGPKLIGCWYKACIQQLVEYFAGKRKTFSFLIQQEGTVFPQRVWSELKSIPFGETISYLGLAKKRGNSKAIRACGTANGQNNIAIVIPCHRVIGSNGKLVGYAGGLWRKKWLLIHEANYTQPTKTLF